jgi:hypothetical protein
MLGSISGWRQQRSALSVLQFVPDIAPALMVAVLLAALRVVRNFSHHGSIDHTISLYFANGAAEAAPFP